MYNEERLFAFLYAHTASLPKHFLIRLNRPLTQIKEEYFCLSTEHILQSLGLNNCVVSVSPRYFIFFWRMLCACFKEVFNPVAAVSPVALPTDERHEDMGWSCVSCVRRDIRKRFTEIVVHHWNRLSTELVTAQILSEVKTHLTMLLVLRFSFRYPVRSRKLGLNDPYGSLPT